MIKERTYRRVLLEVINRDLYTCGDRQVIVRGAALEGLVSCRAKVDGEVLVKVLVEVLPGPSKDPIHPVWALYKNPIEKRRSRI